MKEFSKTISLKIKSFLELSAIDQQLLIAACAVRKNAQAPYSHFNVGVSVLCDNNSIFSGCNVERCSYSQTTHAEQNAIDSMIAAHGSRKIIKVAVVGAPENSEINLEQKVTDLINSIEDVKAMPCGHCLQIIWENCHGDASVEILVRQPSGAIALTTVGSCLPLRFGPQDLGVSYSTKGQEAISHCV